MKIVTVCWHDGYLKEFNCTEIRFSRDLLWMRLEDGNNRHIPLRSVRWLGINEKPPAFDPSSSDLEWSFLDNDV